MIGLSGFEWSIIVAQILMATLATMRLSSFVPWSSQSYQARLPLFFSIGIAPLILGLATVISLGIFPEASHKTHLISINIILIILHQLGHFTRQPLSIPCPKDDYYWYDWALICLLCLWILSLCHDVIFLPLTKNDALEYATVGKVLFEKRTLLAYPVLNPLDNNSGFYGPWTHPPLYVALIYFANILQGSADAPLIMRIIAPWCTLGATGIVFALGRLHNNTTTGLLSALLFLSCPLNFLGSSAALIDPLPILGMALVLATIFGIEGPSWKKGLIQGFVLGLSLWTHSEAILFIPLTIAALIAYNGLKDFRGLFSQLTFLMIIALGLSLWPYFRNFQLFGSPISDNPLIFRLTELDWQGYFNLSRGIDTLQNKILYGFFKGWLVIDAYSFLFWSMTIGIIFYFVALVREKNFFNILKGYTSLKKERIFFTFLTIVVCYLGGVLFSIILDIDLMIRNERYQLIILPLVALMSGYGIYAFFCEIWKSQSSTKSLSLRPILQVFLSLCFFMVMVLQLFALKLNAWTYIGLSSGKMLSPLEDKLEQLPYLQAMSYLRSKTPQNALVLSMKPADMYYAQRRMISYLDPQLVDFYRVKDINQARQMLLQKGVHYIHIPNYALPPLYNSALGEIVSNPHHSKLIYSSDSNQIFDIVNPAKDNFCPYKALSSGQIPWTKKTDIVIGGRKAILPLFTRQEILNDSMIHILNFSRECLVGLWSSLENDLSTYIRVDGDKEYRLSCNLKGKGFIIFYLMEFDKEGAVINTHNFDQLPLYAEKQAITYRKRILTRKETSFIRLGIETRGNSNFSIGKVDLESLCHFP